MNQPHTSVAIIGASETTLWTYWALRNLKEYGLHGEIALVNPNRPEVYGTPTYASVQGLPRVPDLALLITSPDRSLVAARELVDLGVREIICVSDGFRETDTDEGRALEDELKHIVEGRARLIGPNCVGYASFHDSLCAIAEPIPFGVKPGAVSVLSQSGVLTHTALAAVKAEDLGVDQVYSLGNGASFSFADAVDHLVARTETRVICAVIESITDIEALSASIQRGRGKGMEFVWLLMGQSPEGRRIAASHTGAVLADQRVMHAKLDELGVIVVGSFDELTRTAALVLQVGRPGPGSGVFFLTDSGGAAGIAADTAAAYGLPLAPIAPQTAEVIRGRILPGTTVGNPLDSTTRQGPEASRAIWDALVADPNVETFVSPFGMSWPDDTEERRWHRAGTMRPVEATRGSGKKLIFSSLMQQPLTDFMRRMLKDNPHVSVNTGFAQTVSSLARLYDHGNDEISPVTHNNKLDPDTVVDEAAARDILGGLGFRMVRGDTVASPSAAAQIAESIPGPWVAKVAVEGLGHKGRVGGVSLGLTSSREVEARCEEITRRVVALGVATADKVGFMVQQMVFGPEILLGLVRDRVAGPAAVVGVGGWAAETGTIFATIPLPAQSGRIRDVLARSDLPRLIGDDKTAQLADLAVDLTSHFVSGQLAAYDVVEINPVIMAADGPWIADALLIRAEGQPMGRQRDHAGPTERHARRIR